MNVVLREEARARAVGIVKDCVPDPDDATIIGSLVAGALVDLYEDKLNQAHKLLRAALLRLMPNDGSEIRSYLAGLSPHARAGR